MTKQKHPFLYVLEKYQDIVWKEIKKYLHQKPELLYSLSPNEVDKYKYFIDFQTTLVNEYPERKGKYFRPTLVLLMAEALGVSQKTAVKTAAAMQLSEEWLLIQDDFEDNSLKRRGKPCLHKNYSPELAVNASTVLLLIMWQILSENDKIIGEKKSKQIQTEFQKFLLRATLGQTIEIKTTQDNTPLSEEEVLFIMRGKTGYYTVAGPLRLGAILADKNKNFQNSLLTFGENLGICYQIVDDLLDLQSDFEGHKIQYNDIYEGKKTLMLCHLLRKANTKDRNILDRIMSKSRTKKTTTDTKIIVDQMKKYKSLEYSQKMALKYTKKASTLFEQTMKNIPDSPAKDNLQFAIEFVLERKY